MKRARLLIRVGAALLAASALATPTLAGKEDNTVRIASQTILASADPYFNFANLGRTVADSIWDSLIYRDPVTGELKGSLATAWHWLDDRTIELDLREGVKFHNGAEFAADDVVYTVGFVANPENKAVNSETIRWIDRVEKVNAYKVRIVAKRPFPAALSYLASPQFVIHPHEYYAKVGPKGMNERPVGTGPYRVVEHAVGKYLRLERNPDYFRDSPKSQPRIDKVEIRYIPDAQTRVAEAIAGGLDLIANLARDQAEQLRDIPSLQIVSVETTNYALLRMNTMPATPAPQLRDIRVRQAIMHAIDRETMVKFLVGENARVLHAECPPTAFGCTEDGVPRYAYDPLKARRLLADAGFPNGFDIDLYAWRDRNQAEAIIGYLSAVGIRARMRFLEVGAVTAARRAGRAALSDTLWSDRTMRDISPATSALHGFSVDDMNRDPEIRDLLLRGDSSMDPDLRKDAYARALRLIAERAYVLPLYTLPSYYLTAVDLAFRPYPDDTLRLWEMHYR